MSNCVFSYNGKTYSEAEFKKLLASGLLDKLVEKRQLILEDRPAITVKNKQDVERVMRNIFLLTPEEAKAAAAIYDATASAAAKRTGGTKADFYKSIVFDRTTLDRLKNKNVLYADFLPIELDYNLMEDGEIVAPIMLDNEVIGTINASVDEGGAYVDIVAVHIKENYRGKGVGTSAYLTLATKVMEQGFQLRSDVPARRNKGSNALWEKLVRDGFAIKGRDRYILESVNPMYQEASDTQRIINYFKLYPKQVAGKTGFTTKNGTATKKLAERIGQFIKENNLSGRIDAKLDTTHGMFVFRNRNQQLPLFQMSVYENSIYKYREESNKKQGGLLSKDWNLGSYNKDKLFASLSINLKENRVDEILKELQKLNKDFDPNWTNPSLSFVDKKDILRGIVSNYNKNDINYFISLPNDKLSSDENDINRVNQMELEDLIFNKYGVEFTFGMVMSPQTIEDANKLIKSGISFKELTGKDPQYFDGQELPLLQENPLLAFDFLMEEEIILKQGPQAAYLMGDLVDTIYAMSNPNVSSPLHELAHKWERFLTTEERKTILDWAENKEWSRETSEKFARGFEKYLAEGNAPTPELQGVFDLFKKWLLDIYNGIVGSDIDVELNDAMRKIYAQMLGAKVVEEQTGPKDNRPLPFRVPNAKDPNYIGHKAAIKNFLRNGLYEEALSNYEITPEEVENILKSVGYNDFQIRSLIWKADPTNIESIKSISGLTNIPDSYDVDYIIALTEADNMGTVEDALQSNVLPVSDFYVMNDYLKKHGQSFKNTTLLLARDIQEKIEEIETTNDIIDEQVIDEVIQEEPITEDSTETAAEQEDTKQDSTPETKVEKAEAKEEKVIEAVKKETKKRTYQSKKKTINQKEQEQSVPITEEEETEEIPFTDPLEKVKEFPVPVAQDIDKSNLSITEYANYLESLSSDELDNIDFYENNKGYIFYLAKKLMPKKPNSKLVKVSEDDMLIADEYEYITNINGTPFGLNKEEDPDDENSFIWSFHDLRYPDAGVSTTTNDNKEVLALMQDYEKENAKGTVSVVNKKETIVDEELQKVENVEQEIKIDDIVIIKGDKTRAKYIINEIDENGVASISKIIRQGDKNYRINDPISKATSMLIPENASSTQSSAKRSMLVAIAEKMKQMFPEIEYEVGNFKGDFKGLFKNGKVYINERTADSETPIHEFMHPFVALMEIDNPELFGNLMVELENIGKEYIDTVNNDVSYKDLSESDRMKEALTRYLSNNIKDVFEADTGKIIPEKVEEKRSTLIQFIKYWWNKLYDLLFGGKRQKSLGTFVDDLNNSSLGERYNFLLDENMQPTAERVGIARYPGAKPTIFINASRFEKQGRDYSLGLVTPEVLFEDIKDYLQGEILLENTFDLKNLRNKAESISDIEIEEFNSRFLKNSITKEDLTTDKIIWIETPKTTIGRAKVISLEGNILKVQTTANPTDFNTDFSGPVKTFQLDKILPNISDDIYNYIEKIYTNDTESDFKKGTFIDEKTREVRAKYFGYKPKGNSEIIYDVEIVDNNGSAVSISNIKGIQNIPEIIKDNIGNTQQKITEFEQLLKTANESSSKSGRKSKSLAGMQTLFYNTETGNVFADDPTTESGLKGKKQLNKKGTSIKLEDLDSIIGTHHADLIRNKLTNEGEVKGIVKVALDHKIYKTEVGEIGDDSVSDNLHFYAGKKLTPSALSATMTLQNVADFIAVMDNIQFTFEGHRNAINKITAYSKAASSTKPTLKDAADTLIKRIKRTTPILKDSTRRIGGTGMIVNNVKQIEDILNAYSEGDINEIDASLEYIITGAASVESANKLLSAIEQELRKPSLTQDQILELNRSFQEATTIYEYFRPLGNMLNKFESKINKDDFKEIKNILFNVDNSKDRLNTIALNLTTEWLYPTYQSQLASFQASGEVRKGDILSKEDFRRKLRTGDAISFWSYNLGTAVNQRDPIAAIFKVAMVNSIQNNHFEDEKLFYNVNIAYSKFLKEQGLKNKAKDLESFYKKNYLRKASSWEEIGYDEEKKERIYGFVERWAFHEKYLYDQYAKDERNYIEKVKSVKGMKSIDRDALIKDWQRKNKITDPKYLNPMFEKLKGDSFYMKLYTEYQKANAKYGERSLKYGIIPQARKQHIWLQDAKKRIQNLKTKMDEATPGSSSGYRDSLKRAAKKGLTLADELLSEDYYDSTAINLNNTDYNNVRTSFLMPLAEDELDFTLNETVVGFGAEANEFSTLRKNQAAAENLKMLIVGNPSLRIEPRGIVRTKKGETVWDSIAKLPKVKRGIDAKTNKLIVAEINDIFYGISEEQAETTLGPVTINWNKVADKVGFYTAMNNMTLNFTAAVRNVGIGNVNNLSNAFGGRYYNSKNWASAMKDYGIALSTGDFIADVERPIKSKISQLAMRYDAVQGEYRTNFGRKVTDGITRRFYDKSVVFFLNHAAEHQIQVTGMIALMKSTKVPIVKNGVKTGETNLYDAYKVNKDGVYELVEGAQWSKADDLKFTNTLHNLSRELNGNYSPLHKSMVQRTFLGKLMLQYRKYIYEQFRARYSSRRLDFELGDEKVGYYRRFFKLVVDEFRKDYTKAFSKFYSKEGWSDLDKSSFNRTISEMSIMIITGIAAALIASTHDDDEEKRPIAQTYLLIMLSGVYRDLGMYSFLSPSEMMKQTKNPTASLMTFQKSIDILAQLIDDPFEQYENSGFGYEQGDSKLQRKMEKMIPIINQLNRSFRYPEGVLKYNALTKQSPIDADEDYNVLKESVMEVFSTK
ncbi:hypothetical protein [Leptolyngbya phage Lbo-JY46]